MPLTGAQVKRQACAEILSYIGIEAVDRGRSARCGKAGTSGLCTRAYSKCYARAFQGRVLTAVWGCTAVYPSLS